MWGIGFLFWLTVAWETLVACVTFAAVSSTVTVVPPELPLIKYAPPPPLTTASYQTTQHTDSSLTPRIKKRTRIYFSLRLTSAILFANFTLESIIEIISKKLRQILEHSFIYKMSGELRNWLIWILFFLCFSRESISSLVALQFTEYPVCSKLHSCKTFDTINDYYVSPLKLL